MLVSIYFCCNKCLVEQTCCPINNLGASYLLQNEIFQTVIDCKNLLVENEICSELVTTANKKQLKRTLQQNLK